MFYRFSIATFLLPVSTGGISLTVKYTGKKEGQFTMEEKRSMESAKTLGQRLNLSKRQILRLNALGRIPAPICIGGVLRWRLADIVLWQYLGCPGRREFEALKEDTARDGLSMAVQLILLALQLPEHDEGLREACYTQLERVLRRHYEGGDL